MRLYELTGREVWILRRVGSGLPAFESYTQSEARLTARRRILRTLREDGYIVSGSKGIRLSDEAKKMFTVPHENAWSEHENNLIRTLYTKLGPEALAERTGRTPRAVRLQAFRLGANRRIAKWTAREDEIIRQRFDTDNPIMVAGELGRTLSAVRSRASRLRRTGKETKP